MARRVLTVLTLTVWGGLFCYMYASGRVTKYLHPQFQAYVAATGVILLLLAPLWWWVTRGTASVGCGHEGCGHEHGHDEHAPEVHDHGPCAHGSHHDCGHDHAAEEAAGTPARSRLSVGALLSFLILVLPLVAAAMLSPGQFSATLVDNRGMVTSLADLPSAQRSFPPDGGAAAPEFVPDGDVPDDGLEGAEFFLRAPDGAFVLQILDLLYAASEPVLREEFEGRRVEVIGQYKPPRAGETGGRFDLVRMFVVCCAADARPLGMGVRSDLPPDVKSMGWVKVKGTARFEETPAGLAPYIDAESIEATETPAETFLY